MWWGRRLIMVLSREPLAAPRVSFEVVRKQCISLPRVRIYVFDCACG